MAQAGIHALLGMATKPISKGREDLLLGVILGNLFPDADNLFVAAATVMGTSTEGLHRTFTHSFLTIGVLLLGFYLAGMISGKRQVTNLGIGLAIGISMHILVDLLVWFDGVQILWPLSFYVNFWEKVTPPVWFSKLMMPLEFLFMAWYLAALRTWANIEETDSVPTSKLWLWIGILLILFVVFTVLVYVWDDFMTPFGALYLLMLGVTAGFTIRMRKTIDQIS